MADKDIETKLTIARTRLVMSKPFLGALVLRLPLAETRAKWCATTATDARRFYYNPDYIDALSVDQVQFVLAHEALHCALSHFARRGHRVKHRWDLACDYAVNPLLINDGLVPPPGALTLDSFDGMTAEEIYPCLDDHDSDEPMDNHLYDAEESSQGAGALPNDTPDEDHGSKEGEEDPKDGSSPQQQREQDSQDGRGGASQPPPLSAGERDALAQKWQQYLASAAQQAQQAGKLSGPLARLVDHLLQPQLPWRAVLARFLTQVARDDYSYLRPSRREGNVIFPSLRSAQVDVVVALDTSGSISSAELSEFLAEINALKGQLRARVTLLACDSDLAADGPWRFEPWEEFTLPREFAGGGGTDFTPVFDWVAAQGQAPNVLVYFTDAEGDFPAAEPGYPVVWLVKGKAPVPWGQRVQLN
ncbi:MAG: VWA-like domain-containing protein [Sulfuricellaceae bacterium]|jgi:predicted metal-dependent peptidase